MKYILLSLMLCIITPSQIHSQDVSVINVHLLPEESTDLKFHYTYEIDAEGENAVGKTIFGNTIKISLIAENNDTLTFNIEADSTTVSNDETLNDGEAGMLSAMIGLNMKIKCNSKGQLIEILNKEELITEFKNGLTNMSDDRKEALVQGMLNENESLLFDKMYEVNYSLLFKFTNTELSLPFDSKKDSLIAQTKQTPKFTVQTIQKHLNLEKEMTFNTKVTRVTDEFSQTESGYTTIHKPIISTIEELLTTNNKGLFQGVSSKTVVKRDGMVIKKDGDILSEMKPFTQYATIKYVKID